VFERFTERARQVVVHAQDEARGHGHDLIGAEHILLGLVREREGLAARLLEEYDVTLEAARAQVVAVLGRGDSPVTGQIQFAPHAVETLQLSREEALGLDHHYIGTEHVLLGLVRQGHANPILRELGVETDKIRAAVVRMLSGPGRRHP
jgi:ATP-dependent Clp protease ATP-binding subunit ClpC